MSKHTLGGIESRIVGRWNPIGCGLLACTLLGYPMGYYESPYGLPDCTGYLTGGLDALEQMIGDGGT